MPKDGGPFPCCLCISRDHASLLRVHDRPRTKSGCHNYNPKDSSGTEIWQAHEDCARIVQETWVDEVEGEGGAMEKMVFGVDAIVKGRWALVSSVSSMRHQLRVLISLVEMFSVSKDKRQNPRRSYTMHEGQVSQSVPYIMRQKRWRRFTCRLHRATGDRKGSHTERCATNEASVITSP